MEISVLIIARNESSNLSRILPKAIWANEVIVIDDFSGDNTLQIAGSLGATVIQRKFDGYGSQKNFGVAQCRNNWVLSLDADEEISDELKNEISKLEENPEAGAYEIPLRLVFMGKEFTHGKESRHFHPRLFHKDKARFNDSLVHEKLLTAHPVKKLHSLIYHHSYRSLHHYFEKLNHYSERGAESLFEKRVKRNPLVTVFSTGIYFFKHYILYRNILNGTEGLIWSYLNATYHTVKYLKLYQKNQTR